jgi:hypothetical protein
LTVTNTLDSGKGSLRYEIAQAEKGNGKETIDFNIPKRDPGYNASTGAWTIGIPPGTKAYILATTSQVVAPSPATPPSSRVADSTPTHPAR